MDMSKDPDRIEPPRPEGDANDDKTMEPKANTSSQSIPASTRQEKEIIGNDMLQSTPSIGEVNNDDGKSVIRKSAGAAMASFSDFANENLVAVRYATFATVALLTAYGVVNTPLFFRFKTVSEIPASYFLGRKRLKCRIIRVEENLLEKEAIICKLRHLSPAGQLLSRSWFDFLVSSSPSVAVGRKLEDNDQELLKVEIAGIQSPPYYRHSETPGAWLQRLARERTVVSCQLLARRVPATILSSSPPKRRIATEDFPDFDTSADDVKKSDQIAVGRLFYRPGWQLLRSDLASSLLYHGRVIPSDTLYMPNPELRVMDASSKASDLRRDANYLSELARQEMEACREKRGMWSDPRIRQTRKDVTDEVEFQATANVFQKVWRWLRG